MEETKSKSMTNVHSSMSPNKSRGSKKSGGVSTKKRKTFKSILDTYYDMQVSQKRSDKSKSKSQSKK